MSAAGCGYKTPPPIAPIPQSPEMPISRVIASRIIVEGLGRLWDGKAVLINQPGAGGAIGVRAVSSAAPDGYTFGMFALSDFVTLPGTADNLPVMVPRDFIPVGSLGGAPMFITAAPWLQI